MRTRGNDMMKFPLFKRKEKRKMRAQEKSVDERGAILFLRSHLFFCARKYS